MDSKNFRASSIMGFAFSLLSAVCIIVYAFIGLSDNFLYFSIVLSVFIAVVFAANLYYLGKLKKMDINEMKDVTVKIKEEKNVLYMDDRKG
ncbi:MAG: hypothetical protein FWC44_04250 [Methanomassiliicoccaceae archaeon]|nr:hypothetical protein [Methanomassiliicoccaceae archaeon]